MGVDQLRAIARAGVRRIAEVTIGRRTKLASILEIVLQIGWSVRSGVDGAFPLPIVRRINNLTGRIFQLIVNVKVTTFNSSPSHSGVAHRSDQLSGKHRVPNRNMLTLRMEDFVDVAICVLNCDRSIASFPRIDHLTRNW